MTVFEIVMGIILLVMALFLVVAVLMQSGTDKRLSGAIAGGADTFLGKERGSRLDKLLNILTPIVAGVFALVVIVMYVVVSCAGTKKRTEYPSAFLLIPRRRLTSVQMSVIIIHGRRSALPVKQNSYMR